MTMLFPRTSRWIELLLVLAFASLACSLTQGATGGVQPPATPVPFQATPSPPTGDSVEQPEVGEGGGVSAERQDLATFEALVRDAVIQRDQEALAGLMGDPFSIARWQSEGMSMSPAEAAEELVMGWLIPGNPVAFVEGADLTGMLGGTDPLTMWGPDVDARGAMLCTGWGSNASSEAILIVAWDDAIGYYWHAVLIAPEGFA
jgi:hypothetical protein